MTNDDTINTGLCRAYRLAMLLTGEITTSESVTMTAIQTLPDPAFSEVALLSEVARTAWQRSRSADATNGPRFAEVLPGLPEEVHRVSDLPKTLRYCFAMRILIGVTAQACGQAIGLQPEQVDYFVRQATQILARTRLPGGLMSSVSVHTAQELSR